ncbi:FecR family protein [Sunxiuqinia indica]|uniref:FecR family protein n=1 Tax=Sunxiuqinia indica TaxID=2692584 RepID=UPI00135A0F8C|nr:FecR family protein [Sunxiuqinia indica]
MKKKYVSDKQLFHFLNKTATENEILQVKSWLKASHEHKVYFKKFKQAFDAADSYDLYNSINVENQWKSLNQNIMKENEKRGLIHLNANWIKIAAALLIVFGLGTLVYYLSSPKLVIHQFSEATPFVLLPDSSVIYLKSGAKLTTSQKYDREVSLDGEAFFFVKSNPDKMFTVNLNESKIQVHGTTFYVNEGIRTKVKLYEGSISFLCPIDTIDLQPDTELIYNSETKETSIQQAVDTTSFLQFRDAKLEEFFKVLEQRYLYKITIAPDLRNYRVSVSLSPTDSISEILKLLSMVIPMDYTIVDHQIIIKLKDEEDIKTFGK